MTRTIAQPLFGSPLVTAVARFSFTTPSGLIVPGVLARCFQEIQSKGLDIEGIFRKSGSAATINSLQAQFEENSNPFAIKLPSNVPVHAYAGLFKRYLQQLPVPVIPQEQQAFFLHVFDEQKYSKETLKANLKEACGRLPHEHRQLLHYLMDICHQIQLQKTKNQMSINALAIIFAPTCVRIDGVSLMREKEKISFLSPIRYKKPMKFFKSISYDSSQLFQLQLVKDSNSWTRIFEFMMTYPEIFAKKQRKESPKAFLESEKYQQLPLNFQKFLPSYDYSQRNKGALKNGKQDFKHSATMITLDLCADEEDEKEKEKEKEIMKSYIDFTPLDSAVLPNFWKKFDDLKIDKSATNRYISPLYNYNKFF